MSLLETKATILKIAIIKQFQNKKRPFLFYFFYFLLIFPLFCLASGNKKHQIANSCEQIFANTNVSKFKHFKKKSTFKLSDSPLAMPWNQIHSWMEGIRNVSIREINSAILENGLIAASKTPSYQFYWLRDGALIYNSLLLSQGIDSVKPLYDKLLDRSKEQQMSIKDTGHWIDRFMAKFQLNNAPIFDWSRQGDGPGLRAMALMFYTLEMTKHDPIELEKNKKRIEEIISFDLTSMIYITKNKIQAAVESNGEPWEEDLGRSFYNDVFNLAVLQLAKIFRSQNFMPDFFNSTYRQLDLLEENLESRMNEYWRDGKIITILDKRPDLGENPSQMDYKTSRLDLQTLLGAVFKSQIYWQVGRKFYANPSEVNPDIAKKFRLGSVTDPRVQATYMAIREQFVNGYPVNERSRKNARLEPILGRYIEDRYVGGQGWPLANINAAKLMLLSIFEYTQDQRIIADASGSNLSFLQRALFMSNSEIQLLRAGETITPEDPRFQMILKGLNNSAVAYMQELFLHIHQPKLADGSVNPKAYSMSEMISKNLDGAMMSVDDLLWNYADSLTLMSILER